MQVQAIEISLTKLRALGFDVKTADGACPQSLTNLLKPDDQRTPARSNLVRGGSAVRFGGSDRGTPQGKDREERRPSPPWCPSIVGRHSTGSAARFRPLHRGWPRGQAESRGTFGTEIYFVPTKLSDRRVELELRARVAHLDPKLDAIVDGQKVLGLREVAVDTGWEMDFGQTAVLAGLVQERIGPRSANSVAADAPRELIATMFILRSELVQGDPASQSRQPTIEREFRRHRAKRRHPAVIEEPLEDMALVPFGPLKLADSERH